MSESKENKPCGCLTCLKPQELDNIIRKNKEKKAIDASKLENAGSNMVDAVVSTGDVGDADMNTFFGNYVNSEGVTVNTRYRGCNNNYIWEVTPQNFNASDESTWFDFETDEDLRRNGDSDAEYVDVIADIEAVFQIWDDILVDNMLGYDSNGKKYKIFIELIWGTTSGNTIAWAYTDTYYLPQRIDEYYTESGYTNVLKPNLVWGNCFAWTGVTLFGSSGYSSYFTHDYNHYGSTSVHEPVYLPRTGESVVQNRFIRVMVHEVGHIMGLSATWGPYRNYIEDKDGPPYSRFGSSVYKSITGVPVTIYNDGSDRKGYWSGTNAKKYYKGYFDTNSNGTTVNLLGPPLEDSTNLGDPDNGGSNVYINRHWEEGTANRTINGISHPYLDKELMTPVVEGSGVDMPFSLVCIGALHDAGYNFVNYYKGEPYPLRAGYDRKTPLDLLTTTIYVRQNSNPFVNPYYLFSTTPNGSVLNSSTVKLPLQRTQTYRFIRHEPDSGTQHPFNVGTGWQTNASIIEVTSDGTGTAVTGPNGSSANSIVHGQELSFTVPTNYGWDSEEFKYFCYAHDTMIEDFLLTAAPCFDESTKILCLRDDKEEQVLVSELKEGDLVVTYKHGALPILKIGKATLLFNSNPDYRQTIYRLKKTDEMTDDLLVTGRHGILLDDWSTHVTEESRSLEPHTKIDDKVLLSAGYCNLFTAEKEPKIHTIYHFALEGEQRRYGIYANGALMETWDKQSKDVNLQK
jgi:hypothetical protein